MNKSYIVGRWDDTEWAVYTPQGDIEEAGFLTYEEAQRRATELNETP